ncbi:hypothetical protein TheetDRAFT_1243 [Thermoanaerobacter ethanolicus JW 200]|uniref:hypothetical protein n=1 Tax=Thermoanaerobacter ethanolicus TaxID=1757 RepID=UPI000202C1EB|nr:hypothetical protein TheetDRAFT_1243 [Thermoanaerobacter ethanolicus JW 200]
MIASVKINREINYKNVIFAVLMHLTYAQFWIYLVLKRYFLQIKMLLRKAEPV